MATSQTQPTAADKHSALLLEKCREIPTLTPDDVPLAPQLGKATMTMLKALVKLAKSIVALSPTPPNQAQLSEAAPAAATRSTLS
ncbi:hypothetical protein ColTof4_01092 [Colletotrichum tofieldiae]|nr:hypothetical protein ColTof3_08314 [Colletotrichum tofieldiae]GKT68669.1 hypothetical protein ColTof4_01092 [Colletotrichum tofieldiae]GKT96708.1 hypothetical protein Ct61P_14558 [Colletotrichum tofieldiae]